MKARTFLFLIVISGFSTACIKNENRRHPLAVEHYNYCGKWGSANYSLEIWQDGLGFYECGGPVYRSNVYVSDTEIRFRYYNENTALNYNKIFGITAAPYDDSLTGETLMILDGETFYKN